jgi:hypothetical protein
MHHSTQTEFSFATNPAATIRLPQPRPSTFAAVVGIEPRVGDLIREATALRTSRRVTWKQYGEFKNRLQRLVGWHARRPELQSADVYDLAMRRLVAALGV